MSRNVIDVTDEDVVIMSGNGKTEKMDVSAIEGTIVAPEGVDYELVDDDE